MRGDWQFWVDRGGTFTDIVARRPDGALVTAKLLSHGPGYCDAAAAGIARLLGTGGRAALVKLGTTVATNALLTRDGEPVLLAATRGHADLLHIGHGARPKLFARAIVKPEPLAAEVLEIDARHRADGTVERRPDAEAIRAGLAAAHARGLRAVAVALLHGHAFPEHERLVGELARAAGFTQVTLSQDCGGAIGIVGRASTAVADAYLTPVLRRYVAGLTPELGGARLLLMQSNGGLADAGAVSGRDAILSGPAGGIVGMAAAARAAGFDAVIGFDMGGTSTDVSHFAGDFERTGETEVAGVRVRAPMLAIHTVAAGGGSVCGFDGARFRVGPGSAGADPGPAAYGRGGPLTITDANVLLGKLRPELLPRVFGAGGDAAIDVGAVEAGFAALAATTGWRAPALAEAFVTVAVETMAAAIKRISIARGHDLARHALVGFGGAAGQHVCLVADVLGIETVLLHPLAGVLSAYGMGLADARVVREAGLGAALDADGAAAAARLGAALAAAARAALDAQALPVAAVATAVHARVRQAGADATLPVPLGTADAMAATFATAHRARYGFAAAGGLVIDAVSAEAVGTAAAGAPPPAPAERDAAPRAARAWFGGVERDTPLFDRAGLGAGWRADGPAIIADASATTVVEPGWRARVDTLGNLILTRAAPRPVAAGGDTGVDPLRLELFANLFMAIAEEMGAALQATAASVNIKERLDFSCAVFDGGGALIANAPHMPVHLGSMGDSVRAVIAAGAMAAGDAWMLNAPYNGGTHLPDITVVMPVFVDGALAYFTAARGHHADIGGITPGSMPAASAHIDEEGVLIEPFRLVEAGVLRAGAVHELLGSGRWPARNPAQNLADLGAQVAACARGAVELARAVAVHGRAVVDAFMEHVQANAAEEVRRVIDGLADGVFEHALDDGSAVRVAVRIDRAARRATVDFTGTSAQHPGNFNAPRSVCRAAVLYVFRCLIDADLPLNDGCMRPLELIIPAGSMLSPHWPAAVVAGNVETSQVITDALFGALGAVAAAQGTMNNLSFGDAARQYYETIAGGAGAGPGFAGASAVQTHMTNSRITDPEVLETRLPVVLEEFAIRRGSGGAGAWRGGDGAVRRLRFLEPMTLSLLANRRIVPPFGMAGGAPGALGVTRIERADGGVETLAGTAMAELVAGDRVIVETPGGGGWG